MCLAALRIIRKECETATEDHDKREEREATEEGVDEVFDVFHVCMLTPYPTGYKGGKHEMFFMFPPPRLRR